MTRIDNNSNLRGFNTNILEGSTEANFINSKTEEYKNSTDIRRMVIDYISGQTDKYFLKENDGALFFRNCVRVKRYTMPVPVSCPLYCFMSITTYFFNKDFMQGRLAEVKGNDRNMICDQHGKQFVCLCLTGYFQLVLVFFFR